MIIYYILESVFCITLSVRTKPLPSAIPFAILGGWIVSSYLIYVNGSVSFDVFIAKWILRSIVYIISTYVIQKKLTN
jgi:hypothetical protein